MKVVVAFTLLFAGFAVGWLVISGKIANPNAPQTGFQEVISPNAELGNTGTNTIPVGRKPGKGIGGGNIRAGKYDFSTMDSIRVVAFPFRT